MTSLNLRRSAGPYKEEKPMAVKEIKVVVTYTDGYQSRFTEACLRQLAKRKPVPLPAAEETVEPDQKYA